jgi:NADH:ubiquinone oxidoreductase subunit D
MSTFYILDVPENTSVAKVAAEDPDVTVGQIGPYFVISADRSIVIDRRATGCRHAVWYSCIGGVARDSRITRHDKDELRVDPA